MLKLLILIVRKITLFIFVIIVDMDLLQAIWITGTVPTQMTWMIVVLLPKGGGNFCGIGLLDPIWKVAEKVMVARLSVIKLHDCLHGGLPCRGTGTAIMEVKL
jgi:hypothetical protein